MAALLRLSSSVVPRTISAQNLISRAFASKARRVVIKMPGKPLTSWQQFVRDHRDRFLDENGRFNMIVASQKLSEEWKQMTPDQKQPLKDRFLAENVEYNRKLEDALKQVDNSTPYTLEKVRRRISGLPKLKDPSLPKRPKNAYLHYLEYLRTTDEVKNLKVPKDQVRFGAEKWRVMSDNEKKKYQDLSNKERQRYSEEMKLRK